jgi:hypothetical protein
LSLAPISPEVLVNFISSLETTIDYCVSQFHRCSVDEVSHLDKHTLHSLFASLGLESGYEFLRLLIDLGSDYVELWRHVEPIFLKAYGISVLGNNLPFDYVSKDIWHKLFVRLENEPDETIRIHRFLKLIPSARRPESNILQTIPQICK